MIKKFAKLLTENLENSARKSADLEKSGVTTTKVFFGSQALPKELR